MRYSELLRFFLSSSSSPPLSLWKVTVRTHLRTWAVNLSRIRQFVVNVFFFSCILQRYVNIKSRRKTDNSVYSFSLLLLSFRVNIKWAKISSISSYSFDFIVCELEDGFRIDGLQKKMPDLYSSSSYQQVSYHPHRRYNFSFSIWAFVLIYFHHIRFFSLSPFARWEINFLR